MSQLNNTNERPNEEPVVTETTKKKMKSSTKIIIFLVIFAILCIGITVGAILLANQENPSISPSEPSQITPDGLGIKSLTEQYNENDLKITNVKVSEGNRTPKYLWDADINKVNLDYIKIDGLKNEEIENQINKEIMVLVYSLYNDSDLNDPEIDYIEIYARCEANFGNTLSIYVDKSTFYVDEEAELVNKSYYLNYDLTTGNKIKFTDLFTNASLKNVLMQSIYDNVVGKYTYIDSPDGTIDMSKADLSTVEEETYIMLNKLMKNIDNLNFYYTPSYIYVDDYQLSISMSSIYSNIAIYNRFKTAESIFDGTYSGNKNMFVFSRRYSYVDTQYSRYEDIYDNLRVEALIEMDNDLASDPIAKKQVNDVIKKIENEISNIKKEAKNNPKKAYVYVSYITLYSWESFELNSLGIPNDILNTYGQSKVYKMTKEHYDKVFVPEMASYYNNPEPSEYYPVFEYYKEDKNVTIEPITELDNRIDLYTDKTENELLGEYHINGEKRYLQQIHDILNNGGTFDDFEELTAIYNSIISIQKEYNLKDSYLEDALKLLDNVRDLAKQKEQEILNNTVSTNTIENTSSTLNNEL